MRESLKNKPAIVYCAVNSINGKRNNNYGFVFKFVET